MRSWTGALGCALLIGACTVSTVPGPPSSDDDANPGADGAAAADATGALIPCEPGDEAGVCPDGLLCEIGVRRCVECVWDEVRCTEGGQRERCPGPEPDGAGGVTGGFFVPYPCPPVEACLEGGDCAPLICDPGQRDCLDPITVRTCNTTGTAWDEDSCFDGQACYEGQCELIRHNVLLVFDTSGSMFDYIEHPGSPFICDGGDLPCLEPYPTCDDPENPLTKLTLAKGVFSQNIQATLGGFSQFALQRFPQREAGSNAANCAAGWYLAVDGITGDDGSHATQPGGWFDDHRQEVLVVPFPGRSTVDNSDQILRWLDLKETLGPTETPCSSDFQCDGGACGQVNGEGRCFTHDNPELRAGGGTPLGKSLFYAGEYLRRFVAVDGKTCEISEDCGSVGYVCVDGECRDPYSSCREHFIILFTDGAESQHVSTAEFFNPVVQAKRMAFGLGCDEEEDCRGGAACEEGRCVVPDVDPFLVPTLVDPMGEDALVRPDGSALRVRVSVVTLEPQEGDPSLVTQNERIAMVGDGTSLNVLVQDPTAVGEALLEVMTPALKCPPEALF